MTEYCAVIGTHSTVRGDKLLYGLSRKFWSAKKLVRGTKIPWKIGPPGPFSPEKFGPDLE